MNVIQYCPFCSPSSDDLIIIETPYARAICDARPALVGHVLVTSREHESSALDLKGVDFSHLRLVQQEISWRIHKVFGEVGVYEHGRSILCRFHDVNQGYVHAHLHVLPISFDLIGRSGYEYIWTNRPSPQSLTRNDRYLYQETGESPQESWAIGSLPVQRHFVRSELQNVLLERSMPWIPLSSPPDDHDDAVVRTYELLSTQAPCLLKGAILVCPNRVWVSDVARYIQLTTGWPVVDLEMLLRLMALHSVQFKSLNWFSTPDAIVTALEADEITFNFRPVNSVNRLHVSYRDRVLEQELFEPSVTIRLIQLLHNNDIQVILEKIAAIILNKGAIVLTSPEHQGKILQNALHFFFTQDSLSHEQLSSGSIGSIRPAINSEVGLPNRLNSQWESYRFKLEYLQAKEAAELVLHGITLRFGQDSVSIPH